MGRRKPAVAPAVLLGLIRKATSPQLVSGRPKVVPESSPVEVKEEMDPMTLQPNPLQKERDLSPNLVIALHNKNENSLLKCGFLLFH